MKIAIFVSDATHTVHVGGEVVRTFKTFDMPWEMEQYILQVCKGEYTSVSLAIEDEQGATNGR